MSGKIYLELEKKIPCITAHRGLRHEYPENTVESIAAALAVPGIQAVEFDVELASDGVVVLHQETVIADSSFSKLVPAERNYTSRDWVREHTVAEIQALDAGGWYDPKFSSLRVPRLSEVLALPWGEKIAYVEIKDATYWGKRDLDRPAQIVATVLPALANFSGKVAILSFNPEILRLSRKAAPQIPTILLLWTEWQVASLSALVLAKELGATAIAISEPMLLDAPQWVNQAQDYGIELHVYPVSPAFNEPEFRNWTAASQESKWDLLRSYQIQGLTSDFARETVAYFSRLTDRA